jgi:hypothetical protein
MIRRSALICLALAAGLAGCSDPPPEETISRERFIEVYVALRSEAHSPDAPGEIDPEVRDRILAEHGVEAEELIHFVEVHGEDLQYMFEVWSEVEERLTELR